MEKQTPPLIEIAKRFSKKAEPVLLKGGQGTTYRILDIIVKPVSSIEESEELAEIVSQLPTNSEIRIQSPVKSENGRWVENGYAAWSFIEGKEEEGRYEEKIAICDSFNHHFSSVSEPNFIKQRNDPWAIADKVTWDELNISYGAPFQKIIDDVRSHMRPINLPNQIIHGDIAGNIVFAEEQPPGVIDLTLYWRPAAYAKALLVVDAITWENADISIRKVLDDSEDTRQMLLRAALRRIIENPEQVKTFGKDESIALEQANKYFSTLKSLLLC